MRWLLWLLPGLLLAGWIVSQRPTGEARAEAPVPQVRAREIQSIAIDQPAARSQDRGLPLADLRALLATKAGELLDEAKLAADRAALAEELVARGYLAARVAAPSVTFDAGGGAYVVFDIERGPMFHVRSIVVTGPGRRDTDIVTLSAGDDASRARIARARQTLAETLARRGANADVELVLREQPASATVDVELATR